MMLVAMVLRQSSLLAAGAVVFLCCLPVQAHHSFAAEFDASQPITVKGTVVKMDWVNPHSHLMFDVKAEDGSIQHWSAECLPPNGLYRQGWRKDSVKAGDEISVTGFKAKDGSNYMWASSVSTADGRRLFAGRPEDSSGAPPAAPPKE
jgi:hypothetical protein